MITKDSIETAYSFLHQKRRSTFGRLLPTGRKNVYIHSTLDWQKDDIELAIGSYVDDMSQVIGLPLRSSKNSMRPYPTAGPTSWEKGGVRNVDNIVEGTQAVWRGHNSCR